MTNEMKCFNTNHTWYLVDLSEGQSTVKCKWVFKKKSAVIVLRLELDCYGFSQRQGTDFSEAVFQVVKHSTF